MADNENARQYGVFMPNELITDDILNDLLSDNSMATYDDKGLGEEISLPHYAKQLIEKKQLKKSQIIHDAGLNQTFGYQILAGTRRASRDKVIQLAFGLKATLTEAQRLLKHAGLSELYVKNRRDAIIILALENGLSLHQTNDELFRLGENTIMDSME